MNLKIGIMATNIRQVRPRGVARVARAYVEKLASRSEIECFIISDPIYDMNVMMVEHFALKEYLIKVPLDITPHDRMRLISFPRSSSVAQHVALNSRVRKVLRRLNRLLVKFPPYGWFIRRYFPEVFEAPMPSEIAVPDADFNYERNLKSLGLIPLNKFDAVLSFEAFEGIWDWPVESIKTKFIGIFHDVIPLRIDEGPNGRPDQFFRAVSKFVLRADHIVCSSQCTELDTHNFFPASRSKTSVVYLGHDPDTISSTGHGQRRASEFRILMLGDMDRRKNLQGAMQSLRLIAEKLPDRRVVLEIVGNSGQRHDFIVFEEQARQYADIRWTGYIPDDQRTEKFHAADVFLFPSLWEGFGLPILEAMDAELPVVCSKLSSLPEVGGKFATYIDDPYDPQSIADAVLKVASLTPKQHLALVKAAKAWSAELTWDKATNELVAVIKKVLQKGNATDFNAASEVKVDVLPRQKAL